MLLETARGDRRHTRQRAGIQPERNRDHAAQHRGADAAADPFAGAKRTLHRGEHASADHQRHRQRRRRAGRIGDQQQRGADARAAQRRAGQHEAEDRSGAGRPQQAGGNAQQERRTRADLAVGLRERREPVARADERTHQPLGEARQQQCQAEHGEQRNREPASILIGLRDPAAADRSKRRHERERQRHAGEQRQTAARERLVGPREHERQHRQNARAEDGECAAKIRKDNEEHGFSGS